jgi:hypothetical protein
MFCDLSKYSFHISAVSFVFIANLFFSFFFFPPNYAKFMLMPFLKLVYCLIDLFLCCYASDLFYWFCYIFHVCLFLIPNYFVSFFSFMVILLLFLLPSFYQPLFSCFLYFFYCKFAFLIVPFIFKCFCAPILFYELLFGYLDYWLNVFLFFINITWSVNKVMRLPAYRMIWKHCGLIIRGL